MKNRLIACLLLIVLSAAKAQIDSPFVFDTERQQLRYNSLLDELRCPKCQNQNLLGSDAGIATDLRHKVYELMRQGMTDQQIKAYLQQRYGDMVLYNPPFKASTLILWLFPFGFIVLLLFILTRLFRKPKS